MGFQGTFCIFTRPNDWHFWWNMNIRTSVQDLTVRSPGSFFNQQESCFFFACFSMMTSGSFKRNAWFTVENIAKITFRLYVWNPFSLKILFCVQFSRISNQNSKKSSIIKKACAWRVGLKTKKIMGRRVKSWTTAVSHKRGNKKK